MIYVGKQNDVIVHPFTINITFYQTIVTKWTFTLRSNDEKYEWIWISEDNRKSTSTRDKMVAKSNDCVNIF